MLAGTDLELCFQKWPTWFSVQPVVVPPVSVSKFPPAAAQEPPHAFVHPLFCLRASTLLDCLWLRPLLPALTPLGCSPQMLVWKLCPLLSPEQREKTNRNPRVRKPSRRISSSLFTSKSISLDLLQWPTLPVKLASGIRDPWLIVL